MKAVITVIGKDSAGIIAKVSTFLYEHKINILDISQTIMQDLFTMIMLIDLKDSDVSFDTVESGLDNIASQIGVSARIQHEDIFNSMHRI